MANPNREIAYNPEPETVDIDVQFTAGTSGAVGTVYGSTLFFPGSIVTGISKSGTGLYRVALRELWYRCKNINGTILQASFVNTHAGDVFLNVDGSGDSTKQYVEFVTRSLDTTAAATDMTSGDIFKVTIRLHNQNPRPLGF